jgi:hypothetical protein
VFQDFIFLEVSAWQIEQYVQLVLIVPPDIGLMEVIAAQRLVSFVCQQANVCCVKMGII